MNSFHFSITSFQIHVPLTYMHEIGTKKKLNFRNDFNLICFFPLNQQVVDFCEELYASGVRSPYLLAFLIDLYQERRLSSDNDEDELEEKVSELCKQMITTHDTIRAKYWEYILNKFKIALNAKRQQTANDNSNNF